MGLLRDVVIGKIFGKKVLLASLAISAAGMYLKNRRNRAEAV